MPILSRCGTAFRWSSETHFLLFLLSVSPSDVQCLFTTQVPKPWDGGLVWLQFSWSRCSSLSVFRCFGGPVLRCSGALEFWCYVVPILRTVPFCSYSTSVRLSLNRHVCLLPQSATVETQGQSFKLLTRPLLQFPLCTYFFTCKNVTRSKGFVWMHTEVEK